MLPYSQRGRYPIPAPSDPGYADAVANDEYRRDSVIATDSTINAIAKYGKFYNEFVSSRRGYSVPAANENVVSNFLDERYPTQFAGAFKPESMADIAPQAMRVLPPPSPPVTPPPVTDFLMRRNSERTGSGLMRSDPGDPSKPLFREPETLSNPVLDNPVVENPVHINRSVFHRNLAVTRLPNLTTFNSHVYGVWLTIGFFELDERAQPTVEVGFSEGEHERFRSFYIVDRSIPVRFEPGVDHDTSRTIVYAKNLD